MTSEGKDYFLTIESPLRAPEIKVQGSRFIADIFPAQSKEEIETHLNHIRKEFYDATHHCYAFRLGINAEIIRAADDGEPAGTAGKPILMVLEGAELMNVLCVVTRYFGGTKLGTGGLSRAYAEAAKAAVAVAKIKTIYQTRLLKLHLAYEDLSNLERLIEKHSGEKKEAIYTDVIELTVAVRLSHEEDFKRDLIENFSARITAAPL
jgi:uncharacterized YigZ family protein